MEDFDDCQCETRSYLAEICHVFHLRLVGGINLGHALWGSLALVCAATLTYVSFSPVLLFVGFMAMFQAGRTFGIYECQEGDDGDGDSDDEPEPTPDVPDFLPEDWTTPAR